MTKEEIENLLSDDFILQGFNMYGEYNIYTYLVNNINIKTLIEQLSECEYEYETLEENDDKTNTQIKIKIKINN